MPSVIFAYGTEGHEEITVRRKKPQMAFSIKSAVADEIHLCWMKSLRDEVLLRRVKNGAHYLLT